MEHEHNPETVEQRAHAVRLALAMNIATNGRWFCALLVLINAMAGHPVLAVSAALPIALTILVERAAQTAQREWREGVGAAVYVLAFAATISTLIVNW